MRVLIGCFYQESTTFNPFLMEKGDFVFSEGIDSKYRSPATKIFEDRGVEVIPTIYATANSGGRLSLDAYTFFAEKIISVLRKEDKIDGVWLHLHGATEVEGLGSGEIALLKEIREIIGDDIPVSLTLDLHGNIDEEIIYLANIIRSYRTVPHTDQQETEEITANTLIDCIKSKNLITPIYKRIPIIVPGEKGTGKTEPMKSILKKLWEIDEREGILITNFFNGHAWTDAPHTSASVVIIPKSDKYRKLAKEAATELATFIFNLRNEFKFPNITLEPLESIKKAIDSDVKPIFISDSGDNTTGGAPGINTVLLRILTQLDLKSKRVLVASIFDERTYMSLKEHDIGEYVTCHIGVNYNEDSAPVLIKGRVKANGDLLGFYTSKDDVVGKVITIASNNIDIVIGNLGYSFTTINHFISAGLDIHSYDVIIVKQGYLFDELSEIAELEIMALSPGATYQILEKLDFKYLRRPMYPLDSI